jgi:hypothetical protein
MNGRILGYLRTLFRMQRLSSVKLFERMIALVERREEAFVAYEICP